VVWIVRLFSIKAVQPGKGFMSDDQALTVNIEPEEPNSGVFDQLASTQLADDATSIVDTRHFANAPLADHAHGSMRQEESTLIPVFENFEIQKDKSRNLVSLVLYGLGGVLFLAGLFYLWPASTDNNLPAQPIRVQARHDESPVVRPASMDIRINPYWSLANILPTHAQSWQPLTPMEELSWKAGMGHKYFYQRVQTVQNIRLAHKTGTESILRSGIVKGKVWLNMSILFAVAEQGVTVSIEDIEQLLLHAPVDVTARFLRRFKQSATEGELFVLRQMIKVAPAQVRAEILQVLWAHSTDILSPLYIVAAQYDPDPYLAEQAGFWSNSFANKADMQAIVEGKKNFVAAPPKQQQKIEQDLKDLGTSFKEIRVHSTTQRLETH
jgi:hypothetical protein